MGCNPRLFHPHLCWRVRLHGPLDSPFIPQPLLDSNRSSSLTIRELADGTAVRYARVCVSDVRREELDEPERSFSTGCRDDRRQTGEPEVAQFMLVFGGDLAGHAPLIGSKSKYHNVLYDAY